MMEIDEQLREAGERWRAVERPPVVDFPRATKGSGRTRRALAVTAVVATLVVLGAAIRSIADDGSPRVATTQPTTSSSRVPSSPSVITLGPDIVQTEALAVDGARLWVTGEAPNGGAATLESIDGESGEVLANVKLPDNGPFQIAVGDNAIWVCSQQNEEAAHLVKIDSTSARIVAVIPTSGDANVAITPDAIWVDENTGNLKRLDPRTNEVLARVPLPGGPYSAHFITAGPLGIFLANGYDGSVLRVDPDTNTVKVIADVGSSALQPVELDGALWINTGRALGADRSGDGSDHAPHRPRPTYPVPRLGRPIAVGGNRRPPRRARRALDRPDDQRDTSRRHEIRLGARDRSHDRRSVGCIRRSDAPSPTPGVVKVAGPAG